MSRSAGYLLLLVGMAALVAAWLWLGSDGDAAGAGPARPPYVLPVTLAAVERGTVQPSVELTGSVRSARWARLSFELSGSLTELTVTDADRVVAGQVLARLADADERLALASAEAALSVAERELDLLAAGERAEDIERLRAELDAAQADQALAVLEVDRRRQLAESSDVSRAEMDRVEAALAGASARSRVATERLSRAQAGSRPEDIAIAEARAALAAAARDRAASELAKTELRAPWDGVIVRRHRSVGDYITPGSELLDLADLQQLEIHVEVPAAFGLRLGDQPRVLLRVDEAPGFQLESRLHVAVPTADLVSRNFRALVRLSADDADGLLRPGMFVRVTLLLAPLPDTLRVPSDAVRITDDGTLVVVADAGPGGPVGRMVPVRVLGQASGHSAVEPLADEPLSAGDQVVVTGVDLAYPGVSLQPRQASAAAAGPGQP